MRNPSRIRPIDCIKFRHIVKKLIIFSDMLIYRGSYVKSLKPLAELLT